MTCPSCRKLREALDYHIQALHDIGASQASINLAEELRAKLAGRALNNPPQGEGEGCQERIGTCAAPCGRPGHPWEGDHAYYCGARPTIGDTKRCQAHQEKAR